MRSDSKALAIRHSDQESGVYAVFCEDGQLYRYDGSDDSCVLLANLSSIAEHDGPIRIDYHHPFVCVSQRFGLHCAVVDLRDRAVREFSREDYQASFSSYSIGFLKYQARHLFVHQDKWNHLAVTDLETGECLTSNCVDEDADNYKNPNHFDYFHSLLHISPDGQTLLSNGWIWHPLGVIHCFSREQLLSAHVGKGIELVYLRSYSWDRPCTFIDDDLFVIATDEDDEDDKDDDAPYHQLWFFRVGNHKHGERRLIPCRKVICDVFPRNKEGEVCGELYYDPALNCLIAISGVGGWLLTLDGQVQGHFPEAIAPQYTSLYDYQQLKPERPPWQYNVVDHCFYGWDAKAGRLKTVRAIVSH